MQDPSNKNFSQQLERLREQAKARLNQEQSAEVNEESSVDEVVDELQVQRTALEIQYEELQQLYQEYWNLYEFAPCGYITLNDKGIIQRINCRGVELLGTTKETPTQFGLSQFIRSEHQSYFFRALQEAQQHLETQSLELQFVHPNNTYLWLHLDIQPQLQQNNQVQQWHIALTEVTAEKEAEKAREKANRLQLITDSVQGGIAYVDRDQCYQFVNQTYQNWLGRSADEILGKTVEEVIGKEEAYSQPRLEALQKVWQGKATCYKARRPYQNQEMRDVSIMWVPDWDEQGTVEGFYSLIIDITERKESERRVRQQEQFLRSIYEGVNQAIFVMDVDEAGELRWADYNWMSEQLMGVPRNEAKGKSPEDIFSPHLATVIRQNYEHCIASGSSISYEECIPYQQQRSCWLLTLTPLRNNQGRVDRVVGTGINIDRRKELENTLREQVEREQLLNTITRSIRQSLDLQEIAAQTVSQIQQAFQVTRVVLAVADPQKASFELVQAIPPPETAAASLGLNYRFLQSLFQEQQELAIADVTTDSAWEEIQAFAENWGARSLLAVPIWGEHSQLKGIICLQVCHEIRHWRNHEMQLLHDVSDQLAIALQQAQLYQQLETELNQRYQLEDQLRHDAIHDQLTGLPNRIQLRNRLQQRLHHLQWENDDFAVFFLDLNKFKAVNDTLGHSAGDELLILVGQRLKNCLRETDLLVRFGGDEFVIILEHLQDQQGAIAVANRIHETLSNPILLLGNEVTVGTSIGIVLVHDQYTHPDLILRDADIAMYQAKQSGAPYIIFNDR